MGWVNQYSDTLRDLGIEEDELGFPTGSDRGVGMLTDKYIERMRQQLNAWFTNILQASRVASKLGCNSRTICCMQGYDMHWLAATWALTTHSAATA